MVSVIVFTRCSLYVFNIIIAYSDVTFHNSWLFSLLFIYFIAFDVLLYSNLLFTKIFLKYLLGYRH